MVYYNYRIKIKRVQVKEYKVERNLLDISLEKK
jgi:hypothetical protein